MVFFVGSNSSLLDKSDHGSGLVKLREKWNAQMQEDA